MALVIVLNGQRKEFGQLDSGASLVDVIGALELKGDRIAVEHNGEIAQRTAWDQKQIASGDRLEIVHFVGGGAGITARTC